MTRGVRLAGTAIGAASIAGAAGPVIQAFGGAIAIDRAHSEVLETYAICDAFVQLGSDSLSAIHQPIQRGHWFVRVAKRNESTVEISVAARYDGAPIVVAEVPRDPRATH